MFIYSTNLLTYQYLSLAVHAAIIVINEAIDHGVANGTFEALRNPNAHLTDLIVNNSDEYQDLLYKAKGSKCQTALLRVSLKHAILHRARN